MSRTSDPRRRLANATAVAERALLGNSAGVRRSIEGRRTLRTTRRGSEDRTAATPAQHELANRFRRAGLVRFDGMVGTPQLDAAATSVADALDDDEMCEDRGPDEAPGLHRYVVDAHLRLPALGSLLTDDVIAVVEDHYRSHVRVRSVRAYRNRCDGGGDALAHHHANRWHLDPEITCDLRYFVYLHDTGPDQGPLVTVDRPTTRRILRTGFIDDGHVLGPARRRLDESATVQVGPGGTGILIDAEHCLHRAGLCTPGHHRDVVQFWLTPSDRRLAADWIDRLAPDPSFRGGGSGDG